MPYVFPSRFSLPFSFCIPLAALAGGRNSSLGICMLQLFSGVQHIFREVYLLQLGFKASIPYYDVYFLCHLIQSVVDLAVQVGYTVS
jgi:hypothetical protein